MVLYLGEEDTRSYFSHASFRILSQEELLSWAPVLSPWPWALAVEVVDARGGGVLFRQCPSEYLSPLGSVCSWLITRGIGNHYPCGDGQVEPQGLISILLGLQPLRNNWQY